MSTVTANGTAQIAPEAPSAPPPAAPAPPAPAASTDKFSGESGDDYIQWRVRIEATMRAQGVWDAVISPEDETPEMRSAASAVLSAALHPKPTEVVASAAGNPREMFRLLDDKYIPKRNKAKYAERFAAAPSHFCNFKEMLGSVPMVSDDDADSDFKIEENEEEESESESEDESDGIQEDDTEERDPDDGYDSEDDEDYKIDPAKLVEDEDDEDEDMEAVDEEVKKN